MVPHQLLFAALYRVFVYDYASPSCVSLIHCTRMPSIRLILQIIFRSFLTCDYSYVRQREHDKWHCVFDIRTWWLVRLMNMTTYVLYHVA
jgi:hypothetical protein